MRNRVKVSELPEFDMAEHLKSPENIAAYLNQVIDEGEDAELVHALGVAARACGMNEVASAAGMTLDDLYKALSPDSSQPRFETVRRICKALGVDLHAEAD